LLLASLTALVASPTFAQDVDKAKEAARIERECGLKKGTITVIGDDIRLQPSPNEAYGNVDCALSKLRNAGLGKLGFVGNQADPNAVLRPPLRYIAAGPSAQIQTLSIAAQSEKWAITKTATASDGTAIIQIESGANMTNGQVGKLLDRIWKKEFGNISFGFAPRKLSGPNPYDD
jgi:hypothetical protein